LKKDYIEFQQTDSPIGFLITFRSYGTWLHGDERGSVDRNHRAYGTPMLPSSSLRVSRDRMLMKQPPVTLDSKKTLSGRVRDSKYLCKAELVFVGVSGSN